MRRLALRHQARKEPGNDLARMKTADHRMDLSSRHLVPSWVGNSLARAFTRCHSGALSPLAQVTILDARPAPLASTVDSFGGLGCL